MHERQLRENLGLWSKTPLVTLLHQVGAAQFEGSGKRRLLSWTNPAKSSRKVQSLRRWRRISNQAFSTKGRTKRGKMRQRKDIFRSIVYVEGDQKTSA